MGVVRRARLWKAASIVGSLALLLGVVAGALLYRSQDIEQEQTVYPLGLSVAPNAFPGVGLDENGEGTFTFDLTVSNSFDNPNLTVTLRVQSSTPSQNLSIFHCLENSQINLSGLNNECAEDVYWPGSGFYYVNVTSGSIEVLTVQVLYVGSITEPVSVSWLFYAEGEEIP